MGSRGGASAQKQLTGFMKKYDPALAALAKAALAKMRKRVPGAMELVYDNYNALVIGFGPTERASEAVLSIALYPRWVNLFFLQGARLNQGFARTYAVASSAAIVLWSASILRSRSLAPGVAIYGLLVGPAIVLAVLSGHLRLNVHGFGLIVLAQAVWFVVAGALLGRLKKP